MIEVNNVNKAYKNKVIFENFNTVFKSNQLTVLMGENGAGKSTLLNMITTTEKMDKGEIRYFNQSFTKKQIREKIGYIPQEIALYDHLTVDENIKFFKSLIKSPISNQKINEMAEKLNLKERNKKVYQLSGGTKRKANLLIGLLGDPDIIILDEPTEGIDIKSRFEIHELLNQLKQSKCMILTTHHLDEVHNLADHIKVIGTDPFYKDVLAKEKLIFESLENINH